MKYMFEMINFEGLLWFLLIIISFYDGTIASICICMTRGHMIMSHDLLVMWSFAGGSIMSENEFNHFLFNVEHV